MEPPPAILAPDENQDASNILLAAQFHSIQTRSHLADYFGMSLRRLTFILYKLPEDKKYQVFEIPKKAIGVRRISAPKQEIKSLQYRLKQVFDICHHPSNSSHGFVKKRSIVTNATIHIRMKWLLNIDLLDFFPSIHFGRVRGLFMARPFQFPAPVATLLAQICCFNNSLPQGAPTSPIISDMICRRLDHQLWSLARSCSAFYSRYADDITFSSLWPKVPRSLAIIGQSPEGGCQLGEELIQVVSSNGFQVNSDKTRFRTKSRRQEVTGLVVNRRLNVKRSFLREIRGMIHSFERWGRERAQAVYQQRLCLYMSAEEAGKRNLESVLKGKLEFLRLVRGSTDGVYLLLQSRFNAAVGLPAAILPNASPVFSRLLGSLWVLEDLELGKNGTGFSIPGNLVVTCNHVLTPGMVMFRYDSIGTKYPVSPVTRDDDRDIALLNSPNTNDQGLNIGHDPRLLDRLAVAGFPKYAPGNPPYLQEGSVSQIVTRHGRKRYRISAQIGYGMSGGPVIDNSGRLIGIAATGRDLDKPENDQQDNPDYEYGIIPVSDLQAVL